MKPFLASSMVNLRVTRSSSFTYRHHQHIIRTSLNKLLHVHTEYAVGSILIPALAPPKGTSTIAHLNVINVAKAFTSSSVTLVLYRTPAVMCSWVSNHHYLENPIVLPPLQGVLWWLCWDLQAFTTSMLPSSLRGGEKNGYQTSNKHLTLVVRGGFHLIWLWQNQATLNFEMLTCTHTYYVHWAIRPSQSVVLCWAVKPKTFWLLIWLVGVQFTLICE